MRSQETRDAVNRARARKRSPGRPRSKAADTAILQAALDLFIERGLDGVGIEHVAEKAGVARTTVYRRWSSREKIVAEAMASARGSADEELLRSPISRHVTLDGVAGLLAQTVSSSRYRLMVARLIGSAPDHPELMATYSSDHLLPRRRIAARALELGRAKGLVRDDLDIDILLDLVSGAIMHRLFLHPGPYSKNDMRDYLRKVLRELRVDTPK